MPSETEDEGGVEGSLGSVGTPSGLWEQSKQIVEMRGDVLGSEGGAACGDARGGELDGEWEPVDAAADLRRDRQLEAFADVRVEVTCFSVRTRFPINPASALAAP